jgi:predicted amidohydrolase
VKAALVQTTPVSGVIDANVDALVAAVEALPDAELAVFPELFLGGYRLDLARELAQPLDGRAVQAVREVARRASCAIVVGLPEQTAGGVASTALFVAADGEITGGYRKTHLFDRELETFVPGDVLEPIPAAGRQLGAMICFDVEFPEVARSLAGRGADLFVTIAANMEPFREDQELAMRARSLENGIPHIYVNRVGEESGFAFVGRSQVVSGGGRQLALAGDGEATLLVDIPAPGPHDSRLSYRDHLRPELYSQRDGD